MRLTLFVVFFCWSFLAFSQIDQYKIYNISSEDGLLSDHVACVFQDSYGFLWIGSNDGIVRWDGHTFKKYIHEEGNSHSLSNNIVYTLFEDHRKRLWAGTINGLNLYDPIKDVFNKITINPDAGNIPVNVIQEDALGNLWLATSDGLCRYDHDNPKNTEWHFAAPTQSNDLSDGVIFAMVIDQENNLWLGTFNGGLNQYNQRTKKFTRFSHRPQDPSTICSNKINKLMVDDQGNVWAGSVDRGVSVLNRQGKVMKHYHEFRSPETGAPLQNSISTLFQDQNKRIWIGLSDQPLFMLDQKKDRFIPFLNPVYKKHHITCRGITSITEDSYGNTWFCSEQQGLFYTNQAKNNFKHFFYNYAKQEGLSHNTVSCFYQDLNDNTWIGTNGGGLDYLNAKTNSIRSYTHKARLKGLAIQDIKADDSEKLWIGTRSEGLTFFDPATGKTQTFQHDPLNKNSIVYNDITSIAIDDNLIWLGTYGEGVCVYDTQKKQFIHHKNNTYFPFNMLAPAWTNHIYKDSQKRIWIGAYGGLYCFDGKKMHTYKHTEDTGSISNQDINMITEDPKGNIWVVTVAGGLELFVEKTKTFLHYSALYNLPYTLKSIVVDDNGILWLGSNEGIVSFDPVRKQQKRYGKSDGLQGDFFFLKSVSKNKKGELYFGGTNGFNVFHPEKINRKFKPSAFYFTDLYLFGTIQKPTQPKSVIKKSLLLSDTLNLSYQQSFFTVEFSEVNFYAPGKTRYAYKLEGLYDKWIDNKSERKLSFTNLPAGQYLLKIKYTLPNGDWTEAQKKLLIIVSPPWWNTWWFRISSIFIFILVLIYLYKIRIKTIKKRNEELETEVRVRTQELVESYSELQESNEEIKQQKEKLEKYNEEVLRQSDKILKQQEYILSQNQALEKLVEKLSLSDETKNLFFNILAHDLKGPVNAIGSLSDLLVNNISNLSPKEIIAFSQHIKQSSEATQKLLYNLLDWARTQSDYLDYAPKAINLSDLVIQNLVLIEQQCLQKHIHVVNLVNTEHSLFVDYNMLDTVLRNLISNAIKFTPERGSITITSQVNEDEVEIKISDTGLGIKEKDLHGLFLLGKRKSTEGTKGERGTGLGLIIVKEFIEINKGTISVESKEKQGTTFTLRLPRAVETIPAEVKIELHAILEDTQDSSTKALTHIELQEVKGNRILIVEDHAGMRNHLKHLLASTFEILEAENGVEALSIASTHQPIVVITDMVMPVMDGIELCKALKNDSSTSHIPVIILTSHDNEESKLSGYYAGVDIYLTKPVRKEVLFQIVLNIIQSREVLRKKLLMGQEEKIETLDLNPLDQDFLNKINAFIEERMDDQALEVDQIVRHMGMSRSVLYSKFKALTGQGVNEFIRLVRLRKSKDLLKNSRMSINEIADEVGFNSASYFIRCFVKEYGSTPLEFRDPKK